MRVASNGGFTLIELILVTVILGILAGMVVVNFGGRVETTMIRTAKSDIAMISTAIDLHALDQNDKYPESLATINTPAQNYLKPPVPPEDPWGNPYNYKPATSAKLADYEVYSSGPDGIPNTADDVTRTSEHDI